MSQALTELATGSSPQEAPKSVFGYDVIEFIGEGAGSVIYAVTDPATHQLYALKHVVRKTDRDDRFIEQLENEHQVGTAVNHPGIRRTGRDQLIVRRLRRMPIRVTEVNIIASAQHDVIGSGAAHYGLVEVIAHGKVVRQPFEIGGISLQHVVEAHSC